MIKPVLFHQCHRPGRRSYTKDVCVTRGATVSMSTPQLTLRPCSARRVVLSRADPTQSCVPSNRCVSCLPIFELFIYLPVLFYFSILFIIHIIHIFCYHITILYFIIYLFISILCLLTGGSCVKPLGGVDWWSWTKMGALITIKRNASGVVWFTWLGRLCDLYPLCIPGNHCLAQKWPGRLPPPSGPDFEVSSVKKHAHTQFTPRSKFLPSNDEEHLNLWIEIENLWSRNLWIETDVSQSNRANELPSGIAT